MTEIQQASQLLSPLLGTTAASVLFGIALLCSGQSSTLTGTMAGQIVMEGFLNIRVQPWLRRLMTRTLAIIPAAFTVYIAGENGTYKLLILSQIILSMQLPFAVIPLIHFTNDKQRMGALANRAWVKTLAWMAAALILALNIWLVILSTRNWLKDAGSWRGRLELGMIPVLTAIALLLLWVTFQPVLPALDSTVRPTADRASGSRGRGSAEPSLSEDFGPSGSHQPGSGRHRPRRRHRQAAQCQALSACTSKKASPAWSSDRFPRPLR